MRDSRIINTDVYPCSGRVRRGQDTVIVARSAQTLYRNACNGCKVKWFLTKNETPSYRAPVRRRQLRSGRALLDRADEGVRPSTILCLEMRGAPHLFLP